MRKKHTKMQPTIIIIGNNNLLNRPGFRGDSPT